ncbi:MAG: hypothetical protein CSA75_04950 [Sorangium cellulosum]|nr:MAG: hypothetical protein CSA75_04950 [Sorangium cellulosum]
MHRLVFDAHAVSKFSGNKRIRWVHVWGKPAVFAHTDSGWSFAYDIQCQRISKRHQGGQRRACRPKPRKVHESAGEVNPVVSNQVVADAD